jgi:hypothetical protein
MMAATQNYQQPLFTVSKVGRPIILLVCLAFILLIIGHNLIFEKYPVVEVINGIYLSVVLSVISIYPAVRVYMMSVRVAKFYPDYFTISGRKTDKQIGYQDVEGVAIEKKLVRT